MWWLVGIILGEIICEFSNWQHIYKDWRSLFWVQIGNFLDWKGWPNVHILFCLHKNHVLLICNENKEICVANLMKKIEFFFPLSLKNKIFWGLRSEWWNLNGGFEWIFIDLFKVQHFHTRHLKTSSNLLYRIKGKLRLSSKWTLEGALYMINLHVHVCMKNFQGHPPILCVCNFLKILMVSAKMIHKDFRTQKTI